ncbi:462_t:CDS:2, partial [Funneliformis geosporum]
MGLPVYEEMAEITLNCIVKEFPHNIFDITIDKNKNVLRLKDKIKEKMPNSFQNIDIIGIKVWFVQVRQDDNRLNQLSDPSVSVESVLGEKDVYEAQRVLNKIELFLKDININNDDIHVIVQGKEKWCSVCDAPFEDISLLKNHENDHLHLIVSGGILIPNLTCGDEDG